MTTPLIKYVFLLFFGALCAAAGQLALKIGAMNKSNFMDFVNPCVFVGLSLYAVGTFVWIYCMSKVSLTMIYSFTALTFFLVYALAYVYLGERMSTMAFLGLLLVLIGFVFIAIGQYNMNS